MKSSLRTLTRTAALAAIALIAACSHTLHAQTSMVNVRVNVPFPFDYGTTRFSPGTCVLSMPGPGILSIRSRDQGAMAMVRQDTDRNPVGSSKAIFRKYGDRYFLVELSLAGSGTHISVYETEAEKHSARELARRGEEAAQVALVLLPERPLGD